MPIGTTAAILGAGGMGLLGSLLGKKGPSAQEKNALGSQQQLMDTQRGAIEQGIQQAQSLRPQAGSFYGQAGAALQPATDYWSRILAGGPEMTAALSPEISRINAGYQQAGKVASQFAPSGGGRAAVMGELPFRRAADTSTLFSQVRPAAAQNLATTGTNLFGLGNQLNSIIQGGFGNAGAGAGQTGSSLLNYGLGQNQQQFQQGQAIGTGLAQLLFGSGLFGGGGGGGGSKPGSTGDLSSYFAGFGAK